jgi:hypothetical protein
MCRESGTPIRLHANVVTAGTEVEKLQMSVTRSGGLRGSARPDDRHPNGVAHAIALARW